jgi:L-lactate dehydrogenase complex protein LldG
VSETRERILAGIRSSLGRGPLASDREAELRNAIVARRQNPIPARAMALDRLGQIELFVTMATEVEATVARVGSSEAVPEAVARFLAEENLPAELVIAPDPRLDAIPWAARPLLRVRRGRADAEDRVSVTPCYSAVAETGTLMLVSGPLTPTTLNFLPETHIVVLHSSQVAATYEDAWQRLRADQGQGTLPRTINFITGPSRTADIEQHIELGAHGPRRLHIVLVENDQMVGSEDEQQHSETPGGSRIVAGGGS